MIQERIKTAQALLERAGALLQERHSDFHTSYIALNVKRYNDAAYLPTLCQELKLTEKATRLVSAHFTEERVGGIYEDWLEDCRSWVEDFLAGATASSHNWYRDNLLPKVAAGEPTGYPYLDGINTGNPEWDRELKETVIRQWDAENDLARGHLAQLDKSEMLFFGRSGGWLSVCRASTLEDYMEDVKDALVSLEEHMADGYETFESVSDALDYIRGYVDDLDSATENLSAFVEAVEWAREEFKAQSDGMDFSEEMKYRIKEFISKQSPLDLATMGAE